MKMMKLILAASLATIPVMSTLMESASAQRPIPRAITNTYSQTDNNRQRVNSQFNLVNTTRDGNLITDAEIAPNIGLFRGAIQGFTTGTGFFCTSDDNAKTAPNCPPNDISVTGSGITVDSSSGFPIFNPDRPYAPDPTSRFDGDLRAELIDNSIRYSILQPGNTQPASTYRLDLSGLNFDRDQSINDLSYILQQNLLANRNTRPETRNFGSASGGDIEQGQLYIQNLLVEDVPVKIFEPSATLGIFALLSTASLLKRKTKKISAE